MSTPQPPSDGGAAQPPVPPPPPPPPPPPAAGAGSGNNGLAIASLIFSIVGVCCGFGSIIGIILGFVALNQIKKNPAQGGEGMAKAGIIIGFITLAISIIYWIWASANGGVWYYR